MEFCSSGHFSSHSPRQSSGQSSGHLFVVSSPSGGGKTSLIKEALRGLTSIHVSVSYTTRSPRPGEVEGVHYHFVTPEAFQAKIRSGDMLEYAQVFDRFYGTGISALESALAQKQDVVLDIDWQGARQIRERFGTRQTSVFVLPPSLDILRERLQSRGQDSDQAIAYRMSLAQSEMSHFHEYDYLIVNQDFVKASSQLRSIIEAARCQLQHQVQNQKAVLEGLKLDQMR